MRAKRAGKRAAKRSEREAAKRAGVWGLAPGKIFYDYAL